MIRRPPRSTLSYTTLFRSVTLVTAVCCAWGSRTIPPFPTDRKSTRLNSSHLGISYAVFCLKKTTLVLMSVHVPAQVTRAGLMHHPRHGRKIRGFFFIEAAPADISPLSLHAVLPF